MMPPPILSFLSDDARLCRIGRVWCIVVGALLALYLASELRVGWTNGAGRPFGEDFINFWSAARLGVTGQYTLVYDLARFHRFEEAIVGAPLDLYHYSYPPTAWLLTAPLGLLPYPVAWLVWQGGGWLLFASVLRRIVLRRWAMLALATPAVFVNAVAGQNGCWTAGILGWGLILLRGRPALAGLMLSLLVVKPQLAWMIPLALLAGRQWRALAACAAGATALLLLSLLAYGLAPWLAYARQAAMLKTVILENGSGTWHRMISIFVLVRHAPAPVGLAYAAQAVASLICAAVVARTWYHGPVTDRSRAVLVLGVLAGSLYVSDYDCVMITLACAWLWSAVSGRGQLVLAAAFLAPLATAPLALAAHLALCAIPVWLAFLWAAGGAVRTQRAFLRAQA
jgi:hypothetical protein